MAQKCRNPACGLPHDPWVLCQVAKRLAALATNSGATNGGQDATNEGGVEISPRSGSAPSIEAKESAPKTTGDKTPHGVGRTLNRRSRSAYNAYQRLYMQTRRAVEKGLACPMGPQKEEL